MTRKFREDWRELVHQWKAEGGVRSAFARKHGVGEETFRQWVFRVDREDGSRRVKPESLTFVEVELPVAACQVNEAGPALELLMGGGMVMRLGQLPPANWLAELVRSC